LNEDKSSLIGIREDRYEEFAEICYENALNILDNAKILFQARKYARSYALAVIATEELNKALFFKLVSAGVMSLKDGLDDGNRFVLIHNKKRVIPQICK
jgi:AbiV family abortive infection protein